MTDSVAQVILKDDRLLKLRALLHRVQSAAEVRNKIVHGHWVSVGRKNRAVAYTKPGLVVDDPTATIVRVLQTAILSEDLNILVGVYHKSDTSKYQKLRDRTIFNKRRLISYRDSFVELSADLELFVWNDLYGGKLERDQLQGWPSPRKDGKGS